MPTPRAAAIEALTGAGLGSLAGGALSGASQYLEDPPTAVDEHGFVYNRPLTNDEKREQRLQLMKAALLGAALGGTGSVLGGALRRNVITGRELEGLAKTEEDYLEGLRHIVSSAEDEVWGKRVGNKPWPSAAKKLVSSSELLQEQRQALRTDAAQATAAREASPWGGLRLTGGGPTPVPHEELTAEGRTARRFRNLQKEHGLPPMHGPNDTHVGEHFFRALLEKKSSAGLEEELEKISKVAPFVDLLRLPSIVEVLRGLRPAAPLLQQKERK